MEDRYLFKAKRVYNGGEWVQGYYVKGLDVYGKEVHLIFEPNTMFYSNGETDGWYKVDPSTICRCSGREDKNGNLIWENDIVKVKYSDEFEEITQVIYTEHGYSPYSNEYECEGCCCRCEVLEVEVVGNKFDNSELLGRNNE